MEKREITTLSDRLMSRRRFLYVTAAAAAAVACGVRSCGLLLRSSTRTLRSCVLLLRAPHIVRSCSQ